MNDNFITDLEEKAKDNTWQVLLTLKENMGRYIYINETFDKKRAIKVNDFIIFLIKMAPNRDYLPHFKELINKYIDIILPEIVKYPKDERKEIFSSLHFEIQTYIIKQLKDKIPTDDLKELLTNYLDLFINGPGMEGLEKEEALTYPEAINNELTEIINSAKQTIKDLEKEIIGTYELEIEELKKEMEQDSKYIEKNEVPQYIINEMKEMKMKRKQIKSDAKSIKGVGLNKKNKNVFKRKELKEILEGVDKKQVDVALSQKPVKKEQKEQVIYNKSSEAIPKDKGITVEGMGLPVEEKVLDKTKEVVVENKEKEPIVDIKPETKAKPVQSSQDASKVHYDQSEIIKKIKDQQKGKSSIDSKVE